MVYALTPLFAVIFGVVTSGSITIFSVWFNKAEIPQKLIPIGEGIRGIIFALYLCFGLVMLDSFIKNAFLGAIGYFNISYHLVPYILSLLWSISLIIIVVFNAPTRKTIISSLILFGYYIYSFWIAPERLATTEDGIITDPLTFFLIVPIAVEIIFVIIKVVLKKNPLKSDKLWDITKYTKKVLNIKYFYIMSLLFSIELILKFEGLSILYWL